ncbi:MAG: M48 family metallopeptidase [Anaerohalosphaeraceae bacterium]
MDNQLNPQLKALIDQAFSQPINPPKKTWFYHLGLLLVAAIMILLPVIYFLFVAGAGYGVYYYATHFHTLITDEHINARASLVMYFGPLIIGGVLVIFLLLPFIPRRRPKEVILREVDPAREPLFVYFVHKVCDSVGAPRPRQINLLMEPNAYAGFRRGWLSFLSNDMRLAVGLPLISGLTIQQLAGVLAHEFGHFRQGGGMRLHYIIETIHGWFAQCVYGGGWIEEKLAQASEIRIGYVTIVVWLAHLVVWLTRWVMWGFLMAGSAISLFLSRQMEYDADQCEILVGGSRDFEATMYAIETMSGAFRRTYYMHQVSWDKRVVVSDLPALTKVEARDLLAEKKDEIIKSILTDNTRLWDTHPSPRDRITRARLQNEAGICRIEAKSKTLFTDYALLCKELTWTFFEDFFVTDEAGKTIQNVDEFRTFFKQHEPEVLARQAGV